MALPCTHNQEDPPQSPAPSVPGLISNILRRQIFFFFYNFHNFWDFEIKRKLKFCVTTNCEFCSWNVLFGRNGQRVDFCVGTLLAALYALAVSGVFGHAHCMQTVYLFFIYFFPAYIYFGQKKKVVSHTCIWQKRYAKCIFFLLSFKENEHCEMQEFFLWVCLWPTFFLLLCSQFFTSQLKKMGSALSRVMLQSWVHTLMHGLSWGAISFQESSLIATITVTIGFNEGSWFWGHASWTRHPERCITSLKNFVTSQV